jgi:protein-S-isoprenylcysteine O-methyltransferase Ste14
MIALAIVTGLLVLLGFAAVYIVVQLGCEEKALRFTTGRTDMYVSDEYDERRKPLSRGDNTAKGNKQRRMQ